MPNCQTNILDLPLRITAPASTDVIMITHSDGTTEIVTWATMQGAGTPTDVEFVVGGGGGYPDADAAIYQNDDFKGKRVRVFRNGAKQALTDRGGYHYSFNSVSGTITFTPNLSTDEIIEIQSY